MAAPKKEEGLLGVFKTPEAILEAVRRVRAQEISQLDAFTPFPVHGMEDAMGLKRSFIPYLTLVFCLSGACLLYFFQVWTSAIDWPINVGGKPFVSWPAFIPITFEGMVLLGGVLTVVTLFVTLRLPNRHLPPLDNRLTSDLFGLFIDKTDPRFDESKLSQILKDCDALEIKKIN